MQGGVDLDRIGFDVCIFRRDQDSGVVSASGRVMPAHVIECWIQTEHWGLMQKATTVESFVALSQSFVLDCKDKIKMHV